MAGGAHAGAACEHRARQVEASLCVDRSRWLGGRTASVIVDIDSNDVAQHRRVTTIGGRRLDDETRVLRERPGGSAREAESLVTATVGGRKGFMPHKPL